MKDRLYEVADLLLAAAHADKVFEGRERDVIRDLLRSLLTTDEPTATGLPMDLDFRISEFRIETFDLDRAAASFRTEPQETKRAPPELIAAVHNADGEYDIDETAFLQKFG